MSARHPSRFSEFLKFQRARIHRVREMDRFEVLEKLHGRISRAFSYKVLVRRLAYHLNAYSIRLHADRYVERAEPGPQNIETKRERERLGGPFEPYSITVINRAATQLLGAEREVLEVGCGTGMFSFLAAEETHRSLTASEKDEKTLRWAMQHRSRPNIEYCGKSLADFENDAFDIVAAIEVIEHVFDFPAFLRGLARVAPVAIVTTPNKNRSPMDSIANTPEYSGHVREWTSGEFFWVLRAVYSDVVLYTIPEFKNEVERYKRNPNAMPPLARCSVLEQSEPLLAVCRNPFRGVCGRELGP